MTSILIIDVQEKLLNAVFNPETVKKNTEILAKAAGRLKDKTLLEDLKACGNQIIVFGIETHICVHQTVAGLIDNGFEVTVISDACGSRFKEHYDAGLSCMKANGAQIKPTEMVLFELLKSAKHPKFKEIQNLIR